MTNPVLASLAAGSRAILALSWILAGCGHDPSVRLSIDEANGQYVGDSDLLVLPQGVWEQREGLLRSASATTVPLLIVERRTLPEDLIVTFRLASGKMPGLRTLWDGQRILNPVWTEAGEARIIVPSSKLTGGLHLLELVLPPGLEAAPPLEEISWTSGVEFGGVDAANLDGTLQVSSFLEYGVAGEEPLLEGGLLVRGSSVIRLEPVRPSAERLRLGVRNLGGGRGEFVIRTILSGGTGETITEVLDVGESVELGLRVGGADAVEVSRVAATEGALTLWVQPRLVEPAPRIPLILLLTLDTTRKDAIGTYNQIVTWTPRLDELASTASVYENAVSTTSWTLPAHASIFTGLRPREHTAGVTAAALPPGAETLATKFATRYRTVGIAGGPLVRHTFGVGRGFGTYRVAEVNELTGAEVTDLALEFIEESVEEPLFLFLNYFDPHFPYRIDHAGRTARRARAAAKRLPKGSLGGRLMAGGVGAWLDVIERRSVPTPIEIDALQLAYAAEVAEMDLQIGRLLDGIRREGRYDDALIAAVADHGELLGERGLYSHAVRLEPELTSVPLIVKYPGQRSPERITELVSIADLFPTLMRAAALDPVAGAGIALRHDAQLARRESVLFEEHESIVHPFYESIRLGSNVVGLQGRGERRVRWLGGEECWNLAKESWAIVDCSSIRQTALAKRIAEISLVPGGRTATGIRDIDAVERARLRALGYL